jgi:anti-sigma factor RsiW
MENIESKLIDYIDGKLDEKERVAVEREMAQNEEASKLYEQLLKIIQEMERVQDVKPSQSLQQNFEKMLAEEMQQAKGSQFFFQPLALRIAAGVVFVLLGIGIGFWLNSSYQQKREIARLRHEMDSTKQAMLGLLTNQQSASQRMVGATVAYQLVKADDEIVNALVKALNEDPNTNVRLAALEALGKFKHEVSVRKVLIESLAKQNDPVVQISLIQMMVDMKEKSIIGELEKLTQQKEILKAVKDEAYTGILKLS